MKSTTPYATIAVLAAVGYLAISNHGRSAIDASTVPGRETDTNVTKRTVPGRETDTIVTNRPSIRWQMRDGGGGGGMTCARALAPLTADGASPPSTSLPSFHQVGAAPCSSTMSSTQPPVYDPEQGGSA